MRDIAISLFGVVFIALFTIGVLFMVDRLTGKHKARLEKLAETARSHGRTETELAVVIYRNQNNIEIDFDRLKQIEDSVMKVCNETKY